jgi:hypothetical protein
MSVLFELRVGCLPRPAAAWTLKPKSRPVCARGTLLVPAPAHSRVLLQVAVVVTHHSTYDWSALQGYAGVVVDTRCLPQPDPPPPHNRTDFQFPPHPPAMGGCFRAPACVVPREIRNRFFARQNFVPAAAATPSVSLFCPSFKLCDSSHIFCLQKLRSGRLWSTCVQGVGRKIARELQNK